MNDMTYLLFYITFFVLIGVLVPLINDEFNTDYTENDPNIIGEDDLNESSLTFWKVLLNFFSFAFWTFGLPTWLNLTFFLILRIHLILIVARNIWVGGGG